MHSNSVGMSQTPYKAMSSLDSVCHVNISGTPIRKQAYPEERGAERGAARGAEDRKEEPPTLPPDLAASALSGKAAEPNRSEAASTAATLPVQIQGVMQVFELTAAEPIGGSCQYCRHTTCASRYWCTPKIFSTSCEGRLLLDICQKGMTS